MKHLGIGISSVIVLLVIIVGIIYSGSRQPTTEGSIQLGEGYYATTTNTGKVPGLVRTGQGIYGSKIITGAAAGVMNVYDATTTSVLLRSADQSTSTITIATFPASLVAGLYVFDVQFTRGLILETLGATVPTTTDTYK